MSFICIDSYQADDLCALFVFPFQLKVKGDNDPVDVVEIGSVALPMGSVTPVRLKTNKRHDVIHLDCIPDKFAAYLAFAIL